jgi:RNA polymerase sigma factor (sigma-70 family)
MDSGFVNLARLDRAEDQRTEHEHRPGITPVPAAPTPEVVLGLAIAGDRRAIDDLVRALAPRVFDTVRAICGPRFADVDDLAQESLVAFVRALPQFEGRSSILHYARRIAARTAIAGRRRARAEGHVDDLALQTMPETTTKQPYRQLVIERRRAMVRMLLAELPEAQSETLALRFCVGLSMEELAAATEAPLNTVYSRLRLAKAALRARIASDPVLADLSLETSR